MDAFQHVQLLRRFDRSFNLHAAIEEAVRPGSRVLDAGCGLGLLSFWAARCGAAEVIGVDREGTELAADLARENGFEDVVRFYDGDLWDLSIPTAGSFDLIAAMIYLNDPRRDEKQTELAYLLRDRHLAPDGEMLPDRVVYQARLVSWPDQDHGTRMARFDAQVQELSAKYGLSLKAVLAALGARPWLSSFPPKDHAGRLIGEGALFLSPSVTYHVVDYRGPARPYPERLTFEPSTPGLGNVVIWTQEIWFRHRLLFANESVSWVANPRVLRAGERCSFSVDDSWRQTNVLNAE